MASPFSLFRRHQKILTVILTGLAMFAFIVLDAVSRMESTRVMPFLFAAMGAGVFWIWGEGKAGKADKTQILTGAVLGAVIGALPLLTRPAEPGIPTSIGTISKTELLELKQDRELANAFVRQAFNERENAFGFMLQQYLFGGNSTQEVVAQQLLLHEADRLGISIGNDHIKSFIKDVSDGKLSTQTFRKIRTQMGLGEVQLFDLLRDELRAQAAYRVINPVIVHLPEQYWQDYRKVNVRQSVDTTAIPVKAFASSVEAPSDTALKALFEQFSETYPVGDSPGFLQPPRRAIAWLEPDMQKLKAEVGEIPEADLRARYEERKEAFYKKSPKLPELDLPEFGTPKLDPSDAPTPGTTPPGEDDPTTPAPAEPTDPTTPAPATPAPTTPAPATPAPATPAPATPAPATPAPATPAPATPAPATPAPATPAPATPDSPAKPETPAEPEAPAGDAPAAANEAVPDSPVKESDDGCDDQDEPVAGAENPAASDDAATTTPPAETTPAAVKPGEAESPAKPAVTPTPAADTPAEKPTEKPADATETPATTPDTPASPDAPDAPTGESPAKLDEPGAETTEKPESEEPETPEVEYEAFEDVRDELVKLVQAERTRELVDERVTEARKTIGELRRTLKADIQSETGPTDDEPTTDEDTDLEARQKAQEEELAKRLAEEVGEWATDNAFKYRETEPLSQQELVDHDEYGKSIAIARDPFDPEAFSRNQFQMPQTLTVAQRLFSASSVPFVPEISEGQSSDAEEGEVKYAWWATRTVDAHVAEFEESGVREQVEKAYRLREARPIAEERADKIAALVAEELKKPGGTPGEVPGMADAVAAQTVTGQDGSVELTVLPSPPFSWLQRSFAGMQSNPFSQPQVEFGRIPGVDGAGDEFMQAVTKMQVGDVKAIPNVDRSVYYVVHVKARTDTQDIGTLRDEFLREQAPVSPLYGGLARSQSGEIHQQWMTEFLKRYNVDPQVLSSI